MGELDYQEISQGLQDWNVTSLDGYVCVYGVCGCVCMCVRD